jgi:hypothetical protein
MRETQERSHDGWAYRTHLCCPWQLATPLGPRPGETCVHVTTQLAGRRSLDAVCAETKHAPVRPLAGPPLTTGSKRNSATLGGGFRSVAVGAVSARRLLSAAGSHVTKAASHTGSLRERFTTEATAPYRPATPSQMPNLHAGRMSRSAARLIAPADPKRLVVVARRQRLDDEMPVDRAVRAGITHEMTVNREALRRPAARNDIRSGSLEASIVDV